jgi:translocation and assembly module TamA
MPGTSGSGGPATAAVRTTAAVALLWLAPPAVAQDPGGPPPAPRRTEVTDVEIEAAGSVAAGVLRDAIATTATRCSSPLLAPVCFIADWGWAERRAWLDPEEVARDTERLELAYELWGFPEARVSASYDTAASATTVTFRVDEGRPIRVASITLDGLDRLDPPVRPPARLPLRPGDPYALPRLAMIEEWLRVEMAERGHPFGVVTIEGSVDDEARTAELVIRPEPGPSAVFGSPEIRADPPIDEGTVRSLLAFESGEPYDLDRLRSSEMALYRLPIVQRAILQPAVSRPPAGDTAVVPVRVAVVPRKRRGIEAEGTISSTDCVSLAAFWRDRWFLGAPRLVGFGVGASRLGATALDGGFPCTDTGSDAYAEPGLFAQATLIQPWPGHPATRLELEGMALRSSSPGVYVMDRYGGSAAVARDFGRGFAAMLRVAPSRNTLDAADAYFCGSYGVCSDPALDAVAGPAWLVPVELTATWSPTGAPRQTVTPPELEERELWGSLGWRGWVSLGVEGGGSWSGSDWEYVRGLVEASATRSLGLSFEVAGHLRSGWLTGGDALPPFLRLYAGGLYSVRGFAENTLGPAALVTSESTAEDFGCVHTCPHDLAVDPDLVSVRPTGGDRIVEGSLEARWWLTDRLQLVGFVDAGAVRRDPLDIDGRPAFAGGWRRAITPGAGIRVISNLGPIRLDVAYDPSGPRSWPLFAARNEGLDYLGVVDFDPFAWGDAGALRRFARRLQFHVGLGQSF